MAIDPHDDALFEREIVNAIKARGLMESMERWDADAHRRKRRITYMRAVFYPLAAAAMLLGVIFVPFVSETVQQTRTLAASTVTERQRQYVAAGGGSANLIYDAAEHMLQGEYRVAYGLLEQADAELEDEFTDKNDVQYRETKQDIRELKTLCDLSRGQLFYTIRGKINQKQR
ncbi:MAG: hypothetical protein ACI30H_01705 [Paludibacteraceae bacterium]